MDHGPGSEFNIGRRTVPATPYTPGVSDGDDQRTVLLISDPAGRDLRAEVVAALDRMDVPFRMAVVGCDEPFSGLAEVADRMSELLRRFRPHAVHVSVGRTDLHRTVEEDGTSQPARRIADLRRDLHRIADAVSQSGENDLVLATPVPVREDGQDLIRANDIERLTVVVREVGRGRDVLIDRFDLAVDPFETSVPHLEPDGLTASPEGRWRIADSTARAVADALLRADHPWRRFGRPGSDSVLEGIPRPRHPELG
jgi:hypothetical protein